MFFLNTRKTCDKKRKHHHDQGDVKDSVVVLCVIKIPLEAEEDKMNHTHSNRKRIQELFLIILMQNDGNDNHQQRKNPYRDIV